MAMNRRNFLRMSAALTAAGMSPSLFAATKEQFTIYGAPAMPSVTIAVAAAQGKLAKQADVALEIWRSPDQLRAGVASGQFKVMMSPSNVGVNLRNQGQQVGMVNILTNGITQLMCKGGAITSPQELVGKKILVPFKNDMPDIVLQALLKKLNIDMNKVEPHQLRRLVCSCLKISMRLSCQNPWQVRLCRKLKLSVRRLYEASI